MKMLSAALSPTRGSGSSTPRHIASIVVPPAIWYVAAGVCALADSERHFGHAVQDGDDWLAYDAVHPNADRDGFLCLGRFESAVHAKRAIESSVGVCGSWWAPEGPRLKPF